MFTWVANLFNPSIPGSLNLEKQNFDQMDISLVLVHLTAKSDHTFDGINVPLRATLPSNNETIQANCFYNPSIHEKKVLTNK